MILAMILPARSGVSGLNGRRRTRDWSGRRIVAVRCTCIEVVIMDWRFLRNATGIRDYLKRRSISFLPDDSAVPGQLFPSILRIGTLQQNGYTLTHTDPIYEVKLTFLCIAKDGLTVLTFLSTKLYVDESIMPFDC